MRATSPLLAGACVAALLAPALLTGLRGHAQLRAPLALPDDGIVRQRQPNSCAAALLATLLGRAGRPTSEAQLLRASPPGPEGLTLHAFAALARSQGLTGAWYAAPRALTTLRTPFVAHLDRPVGHYVWVRQRVGSFLRVSDPAVGERLWHVDAARARFSGRAFRFDAALRPIGSTRERRGGRRS